MDWIYSNIFYIISYLAAVAFIVLEIYDKYFE